MSTGRPDPIVPQVEQTQHSVVLERRGKGNGASVADGSIREEELLAWTQVEGAVVSTDELEIATL